MRTDVRWIVGNARLRAAVAGVVLAAAVAVPVHAATVTLPASCQAFADTPLVAQATVIKAAHLTQLRTCIADLRVLVALPAVPWTDPTIVAGATAVKAAHVTELRAALSAVFTALGQPVPPFSSGPAAGDVIVAAHLNELRSVLPLLASGPTCSQAPSGLTPNSVSAGATGGQGTTTLGYPAGCPYTATSNAPWLTIVASTTVSITYAVAPNETISPRTGTLTIAGLTFTVTQEGAAEVVTYVDTDAVGSVRMLTDAHGAVVARFDYLPFGTLWPDRPTAEKRLFTGKERDQETAFDYFGARNYAAISARFTTPDPLGVNPLRLVDPQRLNAYAYAGNNPLANLDPDGRDAIAVNFENGGPVSGHSFGHNGIISLHADGTATYADFGPVTRAATGPGIVTKRDLPRVVFGSDGLPTRASLTAIVVALAGQDTPWTSIRLAYFKTSASGTAKLDAWIEHSYRRTRTSQGYTYNFLSQNCGDFCMAGLSISSGSLFRPVLGFSWPNLDFVMLEMLSKLTYQIKPTVTTSVVSFCVAGTSICTI